MARPSTATITVSQCTLAILAGGEGRRMGRAKALLEVRGQPILSYLLERIAWPGATMLVTTPGRERPPGWEQFGREVVDRVAGQGPLRGVLTALESAGTKVIVAATVDMPEIGRTQWEWLIEQISTRPRLLGAMCQRPDGRIEPFPAVFRREALAVIDSRLAAGRGSVQELAEDGDIMAVACPAQWPEAVWTNLNRVEDLERWIR
jgi:molybdopterin-guanine dinucleotide biosynthesis protein A